MCTSRLWTWLAGHFLILSAGRRSPLELEAFLQRMRSVDFVPDYARELVWQAQNQPNNFAAYISSRNSAYTLSKVVTIDMSRLPIGEKLQHAGVLITDTWVRVIHEGNFELSEYPQGVVMASPVSSLQSISFTPNQTGVELGFDHDGWTANYIRLYVSPASLD